MMFDEALHMARVGARLTGEAHAVIRVKGTLGEYYFNPKRFVEPGEEVFAEVEPPEPTTGPEGGKQGDRK